MAARGLSISELARKAGWDRGNLSRLLDDKGGFSKESLEALADGLGVPLAALFDEGDAAARAACEKGRPIPILNLDQIVRWCNGSIKRANLDRFVLSEREIAGRTFAVRVPDETMWQLFQQGDLLIVDTSASVRPGDFVIATAGGEPVFRQYREREVLDNGRVIVDLHPLNEVFPVYRGDKSEIKILGTLFEHRRYRVHR